MNRGQVVKIRLRSAHDPSVFLPYVDVLGTLIHELTHNLVSNHSEKFYKLMDELFDEVEKDEDSQLGNLSVPFAGTGNKLGSRNPLGLGDKRLNVKRLAAEAALRRQKENLTSSSVRGEGGGFLLGGEPLAGKSQSERRKRILNALERRSQDNKTCPAESKRVPGKMGESLWECPECSWFNSSAEDLCNVCHGSFENSSKKHSRDEKADLLVVDLVDEEDDVIIIE